MGSYRIETMSRQQLDLVVDWAREEGWEPGRQDGDCFYAMDPQGFFIGLFNNEPIATISAVTYGDAFGFIGFYIVKPGYRGQGYGLKIWNAALEYLGDRSIGLDGVVAQQSNYQKSGFVLAHNNMRYQGVSRPVPSIHENIIDLAQYPLKDILIYDQRFFPGDRHVFLQCWLTQRGHHALGYQDNHQLLGYGVIRPSHSGYRIGPLFCDRPDIAEAIFLALMSRIPAGSTIFLDIPTLNPMGIELGKNYSMTPIFATARMYKGAIPDLPLSHIYGITTFELG
ncbi:GNAT family N-acetyltransferase [Candidatus Synechococcus calcipolaris G9]|uniref:GNAT family N-acetyltransferase n=1 Tax=Candidatus Synechococcus calcipolaris G9 TaxID=1497997 RepID=A0ABT6EWT4_9SYNE|nr:GNAT family N-acetyltransferase [Candidatus Synechococcus calcipolaris]MDG2990182.1 GNAT family N-acetyltransferase [Candidatus Synechococcus calcipolaris G9]